MATAATVNNNNSNTGAMIQFRIIVRALNVLGKNGNRDLNMYLGRYIDKEGLHKDSEKVRAMTEISRPTDKTEIKAFVGIINYYGKFVPNLSTMLSPIYKLLEPNMDKKRPLTQSEIEYYANLSDSEFGGIFGEDSNDSSDYEPSENSSDSEDEVVSEPEVDPESEDNDDDSQATSNANDNLWTEIQQNPELFIFQENVGVK
ncbi:hypothetical protein ILUMI_18435 [Ignelater luminosus]|uniref:Uncharacterized protein n=1 Tax=Ignelater luminosus TaxID=2038154 RepID=A0A8K0CI02_IGNLU|nr:hypothetical protein ILUMI_18435 [Ignelater luminosus]